MNEWHIRIRSSVLFWVTVSDWCWTAFLFEWLAPLWFSNVSDYPWITSIHQFEISRVAIRPPVKLGSEYWKYFLLSKLAMTCWPIAISSPPEPSLKNWLFYLWRFITQNNGHLKDLDVTCSNHCRNRNSRFRLQQQMIKTAERIDLGISMQTRVCVRTKAFAKREPTNGSSTISDRDSAKFVHATASVLLKIQDGYRGWVSYANLELATKRNENATKGRGRRPLNLYVWCFMYGAWELGKKVIEGGWRYGVVWRVVVRWWRGLDG